MRITAVVGSNNKNSLTKQLIEEILWTLERQWGYQTELVWLREHPLEYCMGCSSCFQTGRCPLDEADSVGAIKQKLMETDCVIFSSPVYAHGCTGLMKNFIDRICSATHVMAYGGKLGFTVAVTASNGARKVTESLTTLQYHLGVKHLGAYEFSKVQHNIDSFASDTAGAIHQEVCHNFGWSFAYLEELFRRYREVFSESTADMSKGFEWNYWNQDRVKNCSSFQEYATMLRKGGRERCLKNAIV